MCFPYTFKNQWQVNSSTKKDEANLETLIHDVVQSSELEDEILNAEQVCSSIATRLGLENSELEHSYRYVDGVVEMILDATQNRIKAFSKS